MTKAIQADTTSTWLKKRRVGTLKKLKFSPTHDFMQRLRHEASLDGHSGCVNCLEWNQHGNLLASGSDDRTVIIWNPFRGTKRNVVSTNHDGNIFSVKFMPNYCDTMIASSASDHSVNLTDIQSSKNLLDCRGCHTDRVKRLAVHQSEPHLLWSAGEDGLILQYDVRQEHICRESKSQNILIDLKSIYPTLKAKCLAINPIRSEMIAVGATDIFNRLFDRRHVKLSKKEQSAVTYFAPGHLLKSNNRSNNLQSYGTTYLSFSPNGKELLASVHAEQVYLFDLNEPWERYKTFERSLQPLLLDKLAVKDCDRNDLEKVKRLHQCSWPPMHWSKLPYLGSHDYHIDKVKAVIRFVLGNDVSRLALKDFFNLFGLINNSLNTTQACPDLYKSRAKLLLSRGWRGDYYQAMRDICCSLALDPLNQNTIRYLADTMTKLGHAYSVDGLMKFIENMEAHDSPNNQDLMEALKILTNFKENAPPKTSVCDNNNDCDIMIEDDNQGAFTRTLLSSDSFVQIQDLLYHSHRKGEELQRLHKSYDYTQRFCGHCNMNTDIKEANFFGADGEYIVGGSDDGAFYVWDKKTSNIIKAADADYQILNCVQPHPNICMLATSGIESTIKLWSPSGSVNRDVGELVTRCMQNQKYISSDPLEAMMLILYPDL